jgi:hypothetical protein
VAADALLGCGSSRPCFQRFTFVGKFLNVLSKKLFIQKIDEMVRSNKAIPSKTKSASYNRFSRFEQKLYFTRVNTGKEWPLDVNKLYEIYRENSFINTTVIKKIMKGRVNSPSVAVLMHIGCIDEIGNRINQN